jgi:hypothetical protein
MIIFSQGVTKHSRIANSFLWMLKFANVLKQNNIDFFFPWGFENFGDYLKSTCIWLDVPISANEKFKAKFGLNLDATSVSQISAKIIGEYCTKNNLPYEYNMKIVVDDIQNGILFLNGPLQFDSIEVLSKLQSYDLVICHEPYEFLFENTNPVNYDFAEIAPKSDLFVEQFIYVNNLSAEKRNIGFHIRRGDYREWQGGKFYFEDQFWIDKCSELISSDVNIWIFSNQLDIEFASKLKVLGAIISNGSFEEDFVRMMFMSEIYGPPSTFPPMALEISKQYFKLSNKFHYLPALF